jgi:hypothetical protein
LDVLRHAISARARAAPVQQANLAAREVRDPLPKFDRRRPPIGIIERQSDPAGMFVAATDQSAYVPRRKSAVEEKL